MFPRETNLRGQRESVLAGGFGLVYFRAIRVSGKTPALFLVAIESYFNTSKEVSDNHKLINGIVEFRDGSCRKRRTFGS